MRTSGQLGKTFGGGGGSRADCQGTQNPILIAINFVPAARLAPDKGTRYSLDKSQHLWEAAGTFLRRLCFLSASMHTSPGQPSSPPHPCSRLLLPSFQILFIHSAGHGLTSSPLHPMMMSEEGAPQRQLFLAENAALVQANLTSPTDEPPRLVILVVTCLLSAAAVEEGCLALSGFRWREKAGERKRKLRGEGEKEGCSKDNEERKREM